MRSVIPFAPLTVHQYTRWRGSYVTTDVPKMLSKIDDRPDDHRQPETIIVSSVTTEPLHSGSSAGQQVIVTNPSHSSPSSAILYPGPFSCNLCPFSTDKPSGLPRHLHATHGIRRETFKCSKCGRRGRLPNVSIHYSKCKVNIHSDLSENNNGALDNFATGNSAPDNLEVNNICLRNIVDPTGAIDTDLPDYATQIPACRFACHLCDRSFLTKQGLGQHKSLTHHKEHLASKPMPKMRRWFAEEKHTLARLEIEGCYPSTVVNMKLLKKFNDACGTERTVTQIKSRRRRVSHKALVASLSNELPTQGPAQQAHGSLFSAEATVVTYKKGPWTTGEALALAEIEVKGTCTTALTNEEMADELKNNKITRRSAAKVAERRRTEAHLKLVASLPGPSKSNAGLSSPASSLHTPQATRTSEAENRLPMDLMESTSTQAEPLNDLLIRASLKSVSPVEILKATELILASYSKEIPKGRPKQ